jgi:hypothetical protein
MSTKYGNIITMSTNLPFTEVFIDSTADFEIDRFEYSLVGVDPVTLAAAMAIRDHDLSLSEVQRKTLVLHNQHVNEYNALAGEQFEPINGYYLNWADAGRLSLSSRPWIDHYDNPEPDHVSLITELREGGGLKFEKLSHVNGERQPLPLRFEDIEAITLALKQLGTIRSMLSDA